MNLVNKAVTTLGGIFLTALLLAALAPKATHGVVAALVQVANTSANPVPVDTVRNSAANFITLETQGSSSSGGSSWNQLLPNGTYGFSPYAIPSGEQLVVTDINVEAYCAVSCPKAGSQTSVVFFTSEGVALGYPFYYISSATYQANEQDQLVAVHSDHLTSGMVFSVLPFTAFNIGFGTHPGEGYTVTIQGYLTP
jgi:hypothetical protein